MFANMLEEDLRIWNIVFELSFPSNDLHKVSMLTANCSAYLSKGLSFISSPRIQYSRKTILNQGVSLECNPQLVAVCNHFEEMYVIHRRWNVINPKERNIHPKFPPELSYTFVCIDRQKGVDFALGFGKWV